MITYMADCDMQEERNNTFVIADNQDITRAGLHGYISSLFPGSEIIDVVCKKELVSCMPECGKGTVVIVDYALFDINSGDELSVISHRFRKSSWLLFSDNLGECLIRRLSSERNIGMLLKECDGEEIRRALSSSAAGSRFLCGAVRERLLSVPESHAGAPLLTPAEKEILKLIARGKSVKEIAALRISSVHTIVTHKKNIFRKLDINNVYEATRYALRAGQVEMADYYI